MQLTIQLDMFILDKWEQNPSFLWTILIIEVIETQYFIPLKNGIKFKQTLFYTN